MTDLALLLQRGNRSSSASSSQRRKLCLWKTSLGLKLLREIDRVTSLIPRGTNIFHMCSSSPLSPKVVWQSCSN